MRLIDADALNTGVALFMAENAYLNMTALDALKMVAEWIQEATTIEAEPVRHGRWKSHGLESLKCSRCGYVDDYKMYHKGCPNCRAKMDGDSR